MIRSTRSRLAMLLLVAGTMSTAAQTPSAAVLVGEWRGAWLSMAPQSQGYAYDAVLTLRATSSTAIDGQIAWTLRRSPRPAEQAKLGMTAVEYVSGTYEASGRVLRLTGTRKDDPNSIIGLDRYHLVLADSGSVLGGITFSNGTWQGLLSTSRQR